MYFKCLRAMYIIQCQRQALGNFSDIFINNTPSTKVNQKQYIKNILHIQSQTLWRRGLETHIDCGMYVTKYKTWHKAGFTCGAENKMRFTLLTFWYQKQIQVIVGISCKLTEIIVKLPFFRNHFKLFEHVRSSVVYFEIKINNHSKDMISRFS